jgi:hypothetical protein
MSTRTWTIPAVPLGMSLTYAAKASGLTAAGAAVDTHAAPAAVSLPVPIAVNLAAAAGLTDGEFGILPFRSLPFGTRQRGTDEPSVYRTVVFVSSGGLLQSSRRRLRRFERVRNSHRCFVLGLGLGIHERRTRLGSTLDALSARDADLLLPSRRRHLGLLVLMIRVTRRATGLLDFFVDHRDNRMIGDAALARTVIVQNVTEPKPALLHGTPPVRFLVSFQVGCGTKRMQVPRV